MGKAPVVGMRISFRFLSFQDIFRHSLLQWSLTITIVPRILSTDRAANVLCTAANIKPGDRVMILVHRIPEYWLIQLACLRTGAWPLFIWHIYPPVLVRKNCKILPCFGVFNYYPGETSLGHSRKCQLVTNSSSGRDCRFWSCFASI